MQEIKAELDALDPADLGREDTFIITIGDHDKKPGLIAITAKSHDGEWRLVFSESVVRNLAANVLKQLGGRDDKN